MINNNRKNIADRAIAALFIVVIFGLAALSISRSLSGSQAVSVEENRSLSTLPPFRFDGNYLTSFPSCFEAFYNDRLAYRVPMVGFLSMTKYKMLGVSGSPRVLAGKKDWFYFLDDGDGETLRHSPLFTDAGVMNWAEHFEARRLWLAEHNIRYVLVIVPSKCEIYSEFVPGAYNRVNVQSRQTQLVQALRKYTEVQFLNLKPRILAAKGEFGFPLYYKTDTHWNRVGAFIGYAHVANYLSNLFSSVIPMKLSDLNVTPYPFVKGDLVKMAGLKGQVTEQGIYTETKKPIRWTEYQNPYSLPSSVKFDRSSHLLCTKIDDEHLPKAFIIGDSFMNFLQPLLSQHFKQTCCYFSPPEFPMGLISQQNPDIVIEEFVERKLELGMPLNPPEVDDLARRDLFVYHEPKSKLQ